MSDLEGPYPNYVRLPVAQSGLSKESAVGDARTERIGSLIDMVALQSSEERYERHLLELWSTARGEEDWDEAAWRWFRGTILEALDPVRLIGDRIGAARRRPGGGSTLEGDLSTVSLLVSVEVDRYRDEPAALVAWLAGPVAEAIERSERLNDGSPEQRVDVAMQGLRYLAPLLPLGPTANELAAHLFQQRSRDAGFIQTLANLATLSITSDQVVSAVLYYLVLRQAAALAADGNLDIDAGRRIHPTLHAAAHNVCAILGKQQDDQTKGSGQLVSDPVREIASLAAVFAPPPDVDQDLADVMLRLSGVPDLGDSPIDFVVTLAELGGSPVGWDVPLRVVARVEACSAVAAALAGIPQAVVARLFNAGVSLMRAGSKEAIGNIRARVLLNTAGLYWALLQSDDLLEALITHDGFDCAVNLASAAADLGQPRTGPALRALVQEVAKLATWGSLSGTPSAEIRADVARLRNASRRLGTLPADDASTPERQALLSAAAAALAEAKPRTWHEVDELDESPLLTIAAAVGAAFGQEELAPEREVWADVVRIAQARREPEETLLRVMRPSPDLFGHGAIVAPQNATDTKGMISGEEWDLVVGRLRQPSGTVSGVLRRLPLLMG